MQLIPANRANLQQLLRQCAAPAVFPLCDLNKKENVNLEAAA